MHKTKIDRGSGRTLHLYSSSARNYTEFAGLLAIDQSSAHMRWHPLRQEWVAHASKRQERTFLPTSSECPLCAMRKNGPLTDIPVDDYEIAIFSNRFPTLSPAPAPPPELGIKTRAGNGFCEVVSFSSDHNTTLATIGKDRITLLIQALADRCGEIYLDDDIVWALPFENRGREIGVTLDHPHGQIYALSHLPNDVRVMAESFKQHNPLGDLAATIKDELIIAKNQTGIAFCPEWARYPFEVWVAPYAQISGLSSFNNKDRAGFASLISQTAHKLDAVFNAPMPYVMSWQLAPKGYEDSHHFHCIFQPVKRSATKQKYIASVEQFTGFFLVDLPPERSADILNGKTMPDE